MKGVVCVCVCVQKSVNQPPLAKIKELRLKSIDKLMEILTEKISQQCINF